MFILKLRCAPVLRRCLRATGVHFAIKPHPSSACTRRALSRRGESIFNAATLLLIKRVFFRREKNCIIEKVECFLALNNLKIASLKKYFFRVPELISHLLA